jgi:ATP-dependent DNA helicase 2 subunit 1
VCERGIYESAPLVVGKKRPADDEGTSPVKKKVKEEVEVVPDGKMSEHWKTATINRLKMDDLKAWLSSKSLPITGKKGDLVDRVEQFFERK